MHCPISSYESAVDTSATLTQRGSMSTSGPFSDISANVLNSTEGAHIKDMSIFETNEHLQELTPLPSAEVEGAGGQSKVQCGRLYA